MDGLLLDTEDLYTACINLVLAKYKRPNLPWSIKADLQGRPGPDAIAIFLDWAELPISEADYKAELHEWQKKLFTTTKPLPGAAELLGSLAAEHPSVQIALATSSHKANFDLKTGHLSEFFSVFPDHRRVLGDDGRLDPKRGKPRPDIFQLALREINDSLPEGETPITPQECLVFEDSVPGVEAGRRAGMRVAWVPHHGLKQEMAGHEEEVLAGLTGRAGDVEPHELGKVGDGWAEEFSTLEHFPLRRYGIVAAGEQDGSSAADYVGHVEW